MAPARRKDKASTDPRKHSTSNSPQTQLNRLRPWAWLHEPFREGHANFFPGKLAPPTNVRLSPRSPQPVPSIAPSLRLLIPVLSVHDPRCEPTPQPRDLREPKLLPHEPSPRSRPQPRESPPSMTFATQAFPPAPMPRTSRSPQPPATTRHQVF